MTGATAPDTAIYPSITGEAEAVAAMVVLTVAPLSSTAGFAAVEGAMVAAVVSSSSWSAPITRGSHEITEVENIIRLFG